jgi:hypothetical protein
MTVHVTVPQQPVSDSEVADGDNSRQATIPVSADAEAAVLPTGRRPGSKRADEPTRAKQREQRQKQREAVQAAIHAAERIRNGDAPSLSMMAAADPAVLASELAVQTAPAPPLSDTVRAIRDAYRQHPIQPEDSQGQPGRLGRPSTFSEVEANHLCEWIQSGKSLNSWSQATGRAVWTVYSWMRQRPDFAQRYAAAHDDRADTLVDEMVALADSLPDSAPLELVQVRKLQIDTRRWLAERLRPKKYGQQADAAPRQAVTFNVTLTPAQREPQPLTVDAVPARLAREGDE